MSLRAQPKTETIKGTSEKAKKALYNYQKELMGSFENVDGLTFDWSPENRQNGASNWRAVFEYANEPYVINSQDNWAIDLNSTGVNLTTLDAGRVDTIAFENGRDYLFWAFLDETFSFAGVGITRKPYSTFSGVASGTKGLTGTFTGLASNAYQFNVGARVLIRNTVGTAPEYEYNWGTVASIVSNSSITVALDNISSYGYNLTGATGGEILQYSNFAPYVVASGSQTLYSQYYCLLGEIWTNSTPAIIGTYRSDEPWRYFPIVGYTWSFGAFPASLSISRYIPLWSNCSLLEPFVENVTVAGSLQFSGVDRSSVFNPAATGAGVFDVEKSTAKCLPNQVLNITVVGTFNQGGLAIYGYCVNGGMRL